MRSVSFKQDVLWALAYKNGVDPEKDNFLLSNQADAYASFINTWVRRLWDAEDWPEWTFTKPFSPANHIVAWDAIPINLIASSQSQSIGAVLKVFLVDPSTTNLPVDTPFRLTPDGVHCGYEHGPTVWIKYRSRCPQYTATAWDASVTYGLGDLAYSPVTGESYKSLASGNTGNDPSVAGVSRLFSPEITQQFSPANPGLHQRSKTMRLYILGAKPGPDPPSTPALNTNFAIEVEDAAGIPLASINHNATGSETLSTIVTALVALLVAALPGGFTVTSDTTALTIDVSNNSDFQMLKCFWNPPSGFPVSTLNVVQIQAYIPPITAVPGQNKIMSITLSNTDAIPGAIYSVNIIDSVGISHLITYTSLISDSVPQVLNGLVLSLQSQLFDVYLANVLMSISAGGNVLTISIRDDFSIDAEVQPPGAMWWQHEPFPFVLVDQVLRGTMADTEREQGQTDRADLEEQKVAAEESAKAASILPPQYLPLSDQQKTKSRYSIR